MPYYIEVLKRGLLSQTENAALTAAFII
jgi:hypothetical protein